MLDNLSNEPTRTSLVRRKGIYLLPNLMTTAALFAGFYAIVASIDGAFEKAAIAVFVAQILDGLDGKLARLTRTESDFGKEYDSLSDMISFGLAPAIVVYQWGIERLVEYGPVWGKLGWLAAFTYTVSAALRLARFNVISGTTSKKFFQGLPSPPAAALVASFVWLGADLGWSGGGPLALAFVVTATAGALMVSRFNYYSFKEIRTRRQVSFTYIIVVPMIFVLIALNPPLVIFCLAATFTLSGPLYWLWRRLRPLPVVNERPDSNGTAADKDKSGA
jgi:CDP-diacylglycerol---serine O-phosphatidyltransferase